MVNVRSRRRRGLSTCMSARVKKLPLRMRHAPFAKTIGQRVHYPNPARQTSWSHVPLDWWTAWSQVVDKGADPRYDVMRSSRPVNVYIEKSLLMNEQRPTTEKHMEP